MESSGCDKCVGWGQLNKKMRFAIVAAYVYAVFFILGLIFVIPGTLFALMLANDAAANSGN
ncbi:hypothetical protein KDA11_05125 [Candidatus Saccharibacteria bacterium]|nr:hypothetical protein [Candidatus Saccharibacteria bacterium]